MVEGIGESGRKINCRYRLSTQVSIIFFLSFHPSLPSTLHILQQLMICRRMIRSLYGDHHDILPAFLDGNLENLMKAMQEDMTNKMDGMGESNSRANKSARETYQKDTAFLMLHVFANSFSEQQQDDLLELIKAFQKTPLNTVRNIFCQLPLSINPLNSLFESIMSTTLSIGTSSQNFWDHS